MKHTLYILILSIILGCSSQPEKKPQIFFNIEELNEDIKQSVGFDLLAIMSRTDSVYRTDTSFYLDLIAQMWGDTSKHCFIKAGIPYSLVGSSNVVQNGDLSRDSLARLMMMDYANNSDMSNCNREYWDSLCIFKGKYKAMMEVFHPPEVRDAYFYWIPQLRDIHYRGYLSKDEFHYIVLYLHYLAKLCDSDTA
ncbi:MAG: hypothetical protein HRT58_12040 [Crocinitomicaceae bacterium]|nr:hypothetical protein [Flavobacteriales bacterium]NQZ36391.1 hypothetical protein [Crocinitomicaceae bacterium]